MPLLVPPLDSNGPKRREVTMEIYVGPCLVGSIGDGIPI
jgi:hypothetical protein